MEKIAFLGLGRMGRPMARRLAAAGYPLTVWNRSPGRAEGLTEAASPAEAVAGAGIVVTMLSDPQAVAEVAGQFTPDLAPGTLWIDMSSIGPRAVAGLRARLPHGVALVDAPVVGSVGPAAAGELGVYAGGEDADLDRAEPLLSHLGRVRRCGGPGAGAALKVVVIGGIVASVAVLAEVLSVAGELGVAQEAALEVLSSGPLAGVVARARTTTSDFPVRLAAKDLALAGERPLLSAARQVLLADPSIAERDLSAVVGAPRVG
ncbi:MULTISPECIES: NAD(P)-dependent oxidoreductase [Kitasatospora]|uniref:NAD(P)-dependent oxidoreductase n=1 Tax=Kitasatospora cathayae TaxID=3004092 RepID=A0ABY7QE44_9ACTN|nr:NAD(P)-dependent oxidoreductase [Kitasatospora sp. HUAS 3-15]WBP91034.1 NAD(P)-dependent oxidoreductase [Kitasatospora sp. HUAS 3-15]